MAHFHISSNAAVSYKLVPFLEPTTGRVEISSFHNSHQISEHLQQNPDPFKQLQLVKPWLINGHAVIHSIYHSLFSRLFGPKKAALWESYAHILDSALPPEQIKHTLNFFQQVYLFEKSQPEDISTYEEMLFLWIANQNPALQLINLLISDRSLIETTAYLKFIEDMQLLFSKNESVENSGMDFITFLLEPIRHAPNDILAQMEYIRTHWQDILGDELLLLLNSMDFIREQEKSWYFGGHTVELPDYATMSEELENFTPDQNWMPRLVLIAKNIHVWLYQLSLIWQRDIRTLDQIPDETLQELASRGISGLWLIGVWERSKGSAEIKQRCGNPEAIASAYSLDDYQIAADLGGEQAYQHLKSRAARWGIRMGTDMVPNHMGLDSSWVKNHPDWFISLESPPYPSYSFHGPNLSTDPAFTIQIEDHYYDRSDAAVVYRYENHHNGNVRYIYHGNDGTSMPWNDTAQLNYLDHNVREAVIQTILRVARLSPIIRFDAAMILTKRHYQRLWYPAPGHGGDIPSRAGRGVSEEAFNRLMPLEFWREVVDRIAEEVPDTLLLAEAFWLMESYFVRTLGMHRVYNSAFMHLLRDEDNKNFLTLIRNTLEYNPEILKRYVNFMNNPDEETAIQQFSKEDKYFGVCTMLATFPGLPMFGHGQIEGFHEKYGMEYRQSYLNEQPDLDLIQRHEREIFPLLKRRYQFSEVSHFHMYDFQTHHGNVNEDVYAYSNLIEGQRSLILYHNRYAETSGSVHHSWDIPLNGSGNAKTLAEALELPLNESAFVIFRDQITNLWYIRKTMDLDQFGLFVSLGAYKYQAFIDFKVIHQDPNGFYSRLHAHLDGKGTNSIEEHAVELFIAALKECAIQHPIYLLDNGPARIAGFPCIQPTKPFADKILNTWQEILAQVYPLPILNLPSDTQWKNWLIDLDHQYPRQSSLPLSEMSLEGLLTLSQLTINVIQPILDHLQVIPEIHGNRIAFGKSLQKLFEKYNLDEETRKYIVLFQLFLMEWNNLLAEQSMPQNVSDVQQMIFHFLQTPPIKRLLQVNQYEGITWFNREGYLLFAFSTKIMLQYLLETTSANNHPIDLLQLINFADQSHYHFDELLLLIHEAAGDSVST